MYVFCFAFGAALSPNFSPPTPLLLSPLRCPTSQLSLSFSLRCRRVAVVLLFFKLTAQLEFFRQCELRCRCHRVAAAHRIVLSSESEVERARDRDENTYFFLYLTKCLTAAAAAADTQQLEEEQRQHQKKLY